MWRNAGVPMSGRDPEAATAAGRVRGSRENNLAVFRGIPFAESPWGENRFLAPVRRSRWDGVRPAVEFGPPPPQAIREPGRTPPPSSADGPAPDCLTVNVWSPDLSGSLP